MEDTFSYRLDVCGINRMNEPERGEKMAAYRITRFAAPDMGKAGELAEKMREVIEGIGAEFIDLVSYGNGKGVVIAKYADQAAMDAAADTAKKVFADMIEAGAIDADSVHPHMGEVIKSF